MSNSSAPKAAFASPPPSSPNASESVALEELFRAARDLTGVQLTERHRSMVTSRLQSRLTDLGLASLSEYVAHLKAHPDQENPRLIALLTTHHTYFFREFSHFEYLLSSALPKLLPIARARPDKTIRIWSAACSRGQEAYSLAMFLDHHLRRLDPSLKFKILGTDVDGESVSVASNGVYPHRELKESPLALVADHWARGSGEIADYVKAKKSLRGYCEFRTGSLLDAKDLPADRFDLIFCRNVFIYFNSEQIKKITQGLLSRLNAEGYLLIGISESLNSLGLPVETRGPSIYQQKGVKSAAPAQASAAVAPAPAPRALPNPIRVVCVDDSPSILTLMKQILSRTHGFEIVGTAVNGLEAATRVAELKPDAITLDIHMPEQTGVEYLERNFRKGHPATVVVSSVSREDASLALRALSAGASDYVEKPALGNLQERGEEIRTKLRCAVQAALLTPASGAAPASSVDKAFARSFKLKEPLKALRVVAAPLSARSRLKDAFCGIQGTGEPPCVILIEGAAQALVALKDELSRHAGRTVHYLEKAPDATSPLRADTVYFGDFKTLFEGLHKSHGAFPCSIQVLGEASLHSASAIQAWIGGGRAQLVLEDLGDHRCSPSLRAVSSDIVPATSFYYLSSEYLCKKSS